MVFFPLFITLILAIALSVINQVLGWTWGMVHIGVLAAVYMHLRYAFVQGAWVILIFGYLSDPLAAGPQGLYPLSLSLAFLALQWMIKPLSGRLLISGMGLSFIATWIFEGIWFVLYGLSKGRFDFHPSILKLLLSSIMTSLAFVPFMILLLKIEIYWQRRTHQSVILD